MLHYLCEWVSVKGGKYKQNTELSSTASSYLRISKVWMDSFFHFGCTNFSESKFKQTLQHFLFNMDIRNLKSKHYSCLFMKNVGISPKTKHTPLLKFRMKWKAQLCMIVCEHYVDGAQFVNNTLGGRTSMSKEDDFQVDTLQMQRHIQWHTKP